MAIQKALQIAHLVTRELLCMHVCMYVRMYVKVTGLEHTCQLYHSS